MPATSGNVTSVSPLSERIAFATAVLKNIPQAKISDANIAFLLGQMDVEGSGTSNSVDASNNPMYTMWRGIDGSTRANALGIQSYPTLEAGALATAKTYASGKYPTTVAAFRSGDPSTAVINPNEGSLWSGNGNYASAILARAAQHVSDPTLAEQFAANSNKVGVGTVGTASANTFAAAGPSNDAAVKQRPLILVEGSPVTMPLVITDGLDNTPWWMVEGTLVGNPGLRRIPDAITFMVQLPPQLTGELLRRPLKQPTQLRLNVGLSTISQGSAHQNGIEPTGSGLLLNLWDSRPDIITASGTTGVFMNQFGVTSLMSSNEFSKQLQDLASMGFRDPAGRASLLRLGSDTKFRVAAQDAFIELLSLFKSNGVIRYTPMQAVPASVDGKLSVRARNEQQWSAALGLSGYQMRHRVGDVMSSGYVIMNYKGRTLAGQFKSFDWTANADSPFRWDFNFTFRVMSDYVPYMIGGL